MDEKKSDIDLIEVIGDDNLSQIITDFAELSLDSLLEDGFLEELPAIGIGVKICKMSNNISNILFARKIMKFLSEFADVPPHERSKQISKLTVDRDHQKRVGEQLMLLIDKQNDIRKSQLLAWAFKARLEQRINEQTFWDISFALDLVRLSTFEHLKKIYDESNLATRANGIMEPDTELQHFFMCGLVDIKMFGGEPGRLIATSKGGFQRNELGENFCDILIFRKRENKNPLK